MQVRHDQFAYFFIRLEDFRTGKKIVLDVGSLRDWHALTDERWGTSVPRVDTPIVVRAAGELDCPSMISVHWQSRRGSRMLNFRWEVYESAGASRSTSTAYVRGCYVRAYGSGTAPSQLLTCSLSANLAI